MPSQGIDAKKKMKIQKILMDNAVNFEIIQLSRISIEDLLPGEIVLQPGTINIKQNNIRIQHKRCIL